jgi:pimeloyl-ACP methyl ester carboxylesterase
MAIERLSLGPLDLEVWRRGKGRPILLLHGINNINPEAPFVAPLAEQGEIIAPSHPGFGHSPRPEEFDTTYDLVQLYLAVLDEIPDENVVVIGFSFGGWIAAELAVCRPRKLARLILVDPVGIKLGSREERDIAHFFNTAPADLDQRAWHDPANCPPGCYGVGWHTRIGEAMSDEDMVRLARNWDSLCLYAWRPHMYNPQLKHWLFRIAVPSLVLWGKSDRIVTPEYGARYAGLIPGAEFDIIDAAGHHPELEQPHAFVDRVARFLGGRA